MLDRDGVATVYEYDENGNRTAVKYANGQIMTYKYLYDIDSEYTWATFAQINAKYGVAQVGALAPLTVGILYKSIPSLVRFVNTSRNIENNLMSMFSHIPIPIPI